jgi:hypothetical protein
MQISIQFSVFMVNKPGILARVLNEFASGKINIVAMTMMDSVEHGVMRVVFTQPEPAREVLKKPNLPFSETQVLCVSLNNKSGELAILAENLAKNHINITYAYCTAGAKGGKTTGVLKVADVKKATKILESHEKKKTHKKKVVAKPVKRSRVKRK